MSDEPTPLDLTQFKSWKIDIVHRFEPGDLGWDDGIRPLNAIGISFDATFSVDATIYASLAKQEAIYTVQYTEDRNPWHRETTGRRARVRRLRDGAWWTFQRRILRRDLIETVKITIPNCRLQGSPLIGEAE